MSRHLPSTPRARRSCISRIRGHGFHHHRNIHHRPLIKGGEGRRACRPTGTNRRHRTNGRHRGRYCASHRQGKQPLLHLVAQARTPFASRLLCILAMRSRSDWPLGYQVADCDDSAFPWRRRSEDRERVCGGNLVGRCERKVERLDEIVGIGPIELLQLWISSMRLSL